MRQRRPHRITIQRFSASVSSTYDASNRTWAELRTNWGHLVPVGGFKHLVAGRDVSKVSHVCEMAYDPSDPLLSKDRLVYGGENYAIEWIENVHGIKREVRVFCRRLAA